jgi:lysine-specific demethylase 3
MTSIFSSSWMCRLCGREACAECFEQVKDLTEDKPGASQAEIAALQARREKHAHSNPFFLSCTRRNEHHAKDFSPMSRFCKAELAQAIKDMEAMLREPDNDALPDAEPIDLSLMWNKHRQTGALRPLPRLQILRSVARHLHQRQSRQSPLLPSMAYHKTASSIRNRCQ